MSEGAPPAEETVAAEGFPFSDRDPRDEGLAPPEPALPAESAAPQETPDDDGSVEHAEDFPAAHEDRPPIGPGDTPPEDPIPAGSKDMAARSNGAVTPPSQPGGSGGFLTDVIIDLGLVDRAVVEMAVAEGRESGREPTAVLLDNGSLDEDAMSRAIAERHGLDHVDLSRFDVDRDVMKLISRAAASRYRAIPIALDSDGSLVVALADPINALAVSDIAVMTRSEVRPVVAAGGAIDVLIEELPEDAPPRPPQSYETPEEPHEEGETPSPAAPEAEEQWELPAQRSESPEPELPDVELPAPALPEPEAPEPQAFEPAAPEPEEKPLAAPRTQPVGDGSIPEELERAQSLLADLAARIGGEDERAAKAEQELEGLRGELAEARAEVERLEARNLELEERSRELEEEKLQELEARGKELEEKSRELEEQRAQFEQEKQRFEEQTGQLQEEAGKLLEETGKLQDQNRELEEQKQRFEERNRELQEQNRKFEERLSSLRSETTDLLEVCQRVAGLLADREPAPSASEPAAAPDPVSATES